MDKLFTPSVDFGEWKKGPTNREFLISDASIGDGIALVVADTYVSAAAEGGGKAERQAELGGLTK